MSADGERDRLLIAYREVFESTSGKMVLQDLCRRHSVFGSSDVHPQLDGMGNALRQARREGERLVILTIMGRLQMTIADAIRTYEEMGDVDARQRDRRLEAAGTVDPFDR